MKEIIKVFNQEYEFDLDDPDFKLQLFGLVSIETIDYSFENDRSELYWVVDYISSIWAEETTFAINKKDEMQNSIQENIYVEYKYMLEKIHKFQSIKGFNDYLSIRDII